MRNGDGEEMSLISICGDLHGEIFFVVRMGMESYSTMGNSPLVYVGEEISSAGWRIAPALDPKKRRGLSVLLVTRLVDQHTGARKGLEWFERRSVIPYSTM